MLRKLLLSKIHRAKITQRDPDYIGSITIREDLLIQMWFATQRGRTCVGY